MKPAINQVLSAVIYLMLDFDGPICSIFAGYPAPNIASQLRDLMAHHDEALAARASGIDDPLQVLRLVGEHGDPGLLRLVADALRDAEVAATDTATPTPQLDQLIDAAKETRRKLVVVSNNSTEAVTSYLRRTGLLPSFAHIYGRYDGMAPSRLKPNSHLIERALIDNGWSPLNTVLVGDSVSDVQAARSTFVGAIGYANDPDKVTALLDAGAGATVTSLGELATAVREAKAWL